MSRSIFFAVVEGNNRRGYYLRENFNSVIVEKNVKAAGIFCKAANIEMGVMISFCPY